MIRKRMPIWQTLQQDVIWTAADGVTLHLEEMTPEHRRRLLKWLERHAESLKTQYLWHFFGVTGPSGEAAQDAFESAMDELERQPALDWLNEQPLVKRLRAIEYSQTLAGRIRNIANRLGRM